MTIKKSVKGKTVKVYPDIDGYVIFNLDGNCENNGQVFDTQIEAERVARNLIEDEMASAGDIVICSLHRVSKPKQLITFENSKNEE